MKIGIFTQPLGHNYGGILQNWSLQQVLRNLGHTSITVRYYGITSAQQFWTFLYCTTAYIVKQIIRHPNRNLYGSSFNYKQRKYNLLKGFVKKYISRTARIAKPTAETLKKYGFDLILVGSDQVWRPCYNKKSLNLMFGISDDGDFDCDFMAYAASFGVDRWELNEYETENAKRGIRKFKAVSVRESSGIELCKRYLCVDAQHVLDPTLLLGPSDYNKLIKKGSTERIKRKIGVYILDMNPEKAKLIDAVCKSLNSEPYYFGIIDRTQEKYDSVETWLSSFYSCQFIITDSFHGTAFSINYNRPFVAIVNHNRGADRFNSLLNQLGLSGRMISEVEYQKAVDISNRAIEWDTVNKKLNQARKSSLEFLQAHIQTKRKQ